MQRDALQGASASCHRAGRRGRPDRHGPSENSRCRRETPNLARSCGARPAQRILIARRRRAAGRQACSRSHLGPQTMTWFARASSGLAWCVGESDGPPTAFNALRASPLRWLDATEIESLVCRHWAQRQTGLAKAAPCGSSLVRARKNRQSHGLPSCVRRNPGDACHPLRLFLFSPIIA